MTKQNFKDSAAKYFIIGVAVAIIYGINQFTENDSFYRNATGISYELIGFLVMLWSTWQTKIRHPQTWQVGISLVAIGLFFQLLEVICVEFPANCS